MLQDHAPIGEVAFRCEPYELLNAACDLWGRSTQEPLEAAQRLVLAAEWYEGLARTMDEIRALPQ